MEKTDASVIIPCHNAAAAIGDQLSALQRQAWDHPWEVVVVDNRSTDGSRKVVRRFQERMPNLRLVDAFERKGAAYSRNTGVAATRSTMLMFCDSDDQVGEGWVAAFGEALKEHDFVAGRFDYHKLNNPWTLRYRPNPQENGLQEYNTPPYLPHAGGGCMGVKREVFDRVGGFGEEFYKLQDTDFCWKVQNLGIPLVYVPEAVLHVRLRASLDGLFTQAMYQGEYNVKLYAKYRPLGMPKLPWRPGYYSWKRTIRGLPRLWNPELRPQVLRGLGWRLGRLKGCIKYRTTAL